MALNLPVRRLCQHAVKLRPVMASTPPQQSISTRLVHHHHQTPICIRQTMKQLCDRHLLLGASVRSQVDIQVCKRKFFTRWRSSSSQAKEKLEGEEGVKDGDERSRDLERLGPDEEEEDIIPKTDEKGQPLSNWARMKIMMKTYGYVIIPVHWVIAPVWFGAFYYTIKLGVDIAPLLRALTVSEHHIEYLQNSKASTALLAYALYKIFTPLRYTVTLGATEFTIRRLRKMGYIRPHPPKEKSYRDSFKETVSEMKDKVKDIRDSKKT